MPEGLAGADAAGAGVSAEAGLSAAEEEEGVVEGSKVAARPVVEAEAKVGNALGGAVGHPSVEGGEMLGGSLVLAVAEEPIPPPAEAEPKAEGARPVEGIP